MKRAQGFTLSRYTSPSVGSNKAPNEPASSTVPTIRPTSKQKPTLQDDLRFVGSWFSEDFGGDEFIKGDTVENDVSQQKACFDQSGNVESESSTLWWYLNQSPLEDAPVMAWMGTHQ